MENTEEVLKKMKIIGIVGGMGAGKTTVVSMIQTFKKAFVISADQIGHSLLLKESKAYSLVVAAFGTEILSKEKEIIREKLGHIVFNDNHKLKQLNSIIHPLIYNEVQRQIDVCKREGLFELIIIDAALLIEIGLVNLTDLVVAVYAEEETRIARIMKRQSLMRDQVVERFKAQKKWEEFTNIADFIINNSISLEDTQIQIKNIMVNL